MKIQRFLLLCAMECPALRRKFCGRQTASLPRQEAAHRDTRGRPAATHDARRENCPARPVPLLCLVRLRHARPHLARRGGCAALDQRGRAEPFAPRGGRQTQPPGHSAHFPRRRHPRLPHALAHSSGRVVQLGHGPGGPQCGGCRTGGFGSWHTADLRADGGHFKRPALGTHHGDFGRECLSRFVHDGSPRAGISRH